MAAPARTRFALLALAALVLLAGCAAFAPDGAGTDTATPTAIGQNATERYERVQSINATVDLRIDGPNETTHLRFELSQRLDTWEYRQRLLAPDRMAGNVLVSNGSTLSMYNATSNEVRTQPLATGLDTGRNFNRTVERIFAVINDESQRTLSKPAVGVAPMPSMPTASGEVEEATNDSVGTLVVEYAGRATVEGRDAHVVRLTPTDPDAAGTVLLNQTLWFDTEWYFPVKATTTVQLANGTQERTVVYENLTVNPDPRDGVFEFDPPENATVEEPRTDVTVYESPDEAATAVNFTVVSPTVPDEFERTRVAVYRLENATGYRARYGNRSDAVVVEKWANLSEPYPFETTPVTVGNTTGKYADFGTKRSVIFDCRGYTYGVVTTLPKEDALGVATSIACD